MPDESIEAWAERTFSPDARDRMASSGTALPDGSYPIPDRDALRRAIASYGRAPAGKKAQVKAHIVKRARALGATDMLPEGWSVAIEAVPAVVFAAPAVEQTPASPEFPILEAQTYVKGGRRIEVTESDLDEAVANFNRWRSSGAEIPVDVDHSFADGGSSEAVGWYASLRRDGSKLLASIRWNAETIRKLRSRAFQYFSPEFVKNWQNERGEDEGFTIIAGAITNRPFLRGLTRVAFSQDEPPIEAFIEHLGALEERLSRQDDTRREVPAKRDEKPAKGEQERSEERPPEDGTPKGTEPERNAEKPDEETVTMSRREADELRAAAEANKPERFAQRIAALEADLTAERFGRAFEQAQREGRVDAKDETREKWNKRVEKFGLDETVELLNDLPADSIPVSERGRGGESAEDRAEVPEGQDADRVMLDRRIRERAAREKISYTEAFDREVEDEAARQRSAA